MCLDGKDKKRKEFMMQQKVWGVRVFLVISFILFLSKSAIAGVPVPWGAKLIQNDDLSSGGDERKITTYETGTSKQELLNYYLRVMPNQGYTLFMHGEQCLVFQKGDELIIVILPPSIEGKTRFTITSASMGAAGRGGETSCENIPSIPAYPGARCNRSLRLGSGKGQIVSYFSTDTVDTVLNYYRSFMMRSQWRLIEESSPAENILKATQAEVKPESTEMAMQIFKGARSMKFANDRDNGCVIMVMNSAFGGGAAISITYEEKRSK
jgi:hypothetical protein